MKYCVSFTKSLGALRVSSVFLFSDKTPLLCSLSSFRHFQYINHIDSLSDFLYLASSPITGRHLQSSLQNPFFFKTVAEKFRHGIHIANLLTMVKQRDILHANSAWIIELSVHSISVSLSSQWNMCTWHCW